MSVPFGYLLLMTMAAVTWTQVTSYRAAVYEHALGAPPVTSVPVTRETAVDYMEKNLAVYRQQAAEAKRQRADILVFPEDGIYGFFFTRDTIFPYLEFIPDPHQVTWSPCSDPDRYPETEVQHALSCMALSNSLYLVANLGDKQPCDRDLDSECPEDGRYQYNTAVAYGPDGTLLARYHKTHLYKEFQFDYPKPSVTYFSTPFGNFGLLICFDILFDEPLVSMVTQHNVDNIIFPTAWMDSLPLLSAIGYHSSVARGLGVNLLTSNLHIPTHRFQGSGIFTSSGMATFYYNNTAGSPPRLLVADVTEKCTSSCRRRRHLDSKLRSVRPRRSAVQNTYNNGNKNNNNGNNPHNNNHLSITSLTNTHATFTNRNFSFVQLAEGSSTAHVCRQDVCCTLNYTMAGQANNPELFVLGAFDGVFHSKYYFQACTVLKCPSLNVSTCGSYTFDSSTTFSRLTLTAKTTTEFIFPQVVLSRHGQLELTPADHWIYSASNKTIAITQALDAPLLLASLVGRKFEEDPVFHFTPPAIHQDNSGNIMTCPAVLTVVSTTLSLWMFSPMF